MLRNPQDLKVGRTTDPKCYTLETKFPLSLQPVPRGAVPPVAEMAEKIPVEPDQGNACAGKVTNPFAIPLTRRFPPFRFKNN
jgi:hypothetical protein